MSKNVNIADLINYISVDGSGNVVLTTGGQVATQSYVTTAVSNLVNSAPSTLDTLNELATALGNDANFATTVTNSIATKLPLSGGTLTGALQINTSGLVDGETALRLRNPSGGLVPATVGIYFQGGYSTDTEGVAAIRGGRATAGNDSFLSFLTNPGGTSLVERIRILNNGNVGIGTSSPQASLTVLNKTPTNWNTALFANSGFVFGSTGSGLYIGQGASTGNTFSQIEAVGSGGNVYQNLALQPSGGNIGIGTSSPDSKLNINSGSVRALRIDVSSGVQGFSMSPNGIFGIDEPGIGNGRFIINTSGNMGVGTSLPIYRAHIIVPSGSAFLGISNQGVDTGHRQMRMGFGGNGANTHCEIQGTSLNVADNINLVLQPGGANVGVGVTNPVHKLQVSGNIYSTDTVFGRNLKPEAWAGPVAGTPSAAGIPLGYSSINISSVCDNNWRTILSNINDSKFFMWVVFGDAASKNTASYSFQMTSPAYGVSNMQQISYLTGGWNTGSFEFTYSNANGTHTLLVRCSSYYNSGNTAYGTIYFLRLE